MITMVDVTSSNIVVDSDRGALSLDYEEPSMHTLLGY